MKTIDREELKAKLDRGDDFELVMTLGELAYQAKHIPGSRNIYRKDDLLEALKPEDEIVVYCSNPECPASVMAFNFLESRGYEHVRRYAGGLLDWEGAGYPLVGELVEAE